MFEMRKNLSLAAIGLYYHLRHLEQSGKRIPGNLAIAKLLGSTDARIARILNELESKGLILRDPPTNNKVVGRRTKTIDFGSFANLKEG